MQVKKNDEIIRLHMRAIIRISVDFPGFLTRIDPSFYCMKYNDIRS